MNIETQIQELFKSWSSETATSIILLPQSGSYRQYFRITYSKGSILGVYNNDVKENRAFIEFTKHFKNCKLNVPEIFSISNDELIYLIEDLGDETLYSYLTEQKKELGFSPQLIATYKKVIDALPKFQIEAGSNLDYNNCYPRSSFDKQSMMWDLNYFKYYFLKLAKINFDEQKLEDDFQIFSDYLLAAHGNYFLYRDFQSRNIMLKDDSPYFIDYQGGRKGALQYDVASLLYDAKADIPQEIRNELLEYYMNVVSNYIEIDKASFRQMYYGYVFIRIMQAMGAYGFRGFYEKKEHFLKSIPFAIKNIEYLLSNTEFPVNAPTLVDALWQITKSEELKKVAGTEEQNVLTVDIRSFSYRNGIPVDNSGNGGGFVFDCRAIHNPGKYEEFKQLTGRDKEVIDFFNSGNEMSAFLSSVFKICEQSIEKYQKRGFANLSIFFGCTGGQHRSVFSAESLAKHIRSKYKVNVRLSHRELDLK